MYVYLDLNVDSYLLQLALLAPIINRLEKPSQRESSRKRKEMGQIQTYQATKTIAPWTIGLGVFIEIDNKKDKTNNDGNQSSNAYKPPNPPQRFPTLEEAQRAWHFSRRGISAFEEVHDIRTGIGRFVFLLRPGTAHGNVRIASQANAFTESIGGSQNTQTNRQTHDKPSNMGEIVQAREQT